MKRISSLILISLMSLNSCEMLFSGNSNSSSESSTESTSNSSLSSIGEDSSSEISSEASSSTSSSSSSVGEETGWKLSWSDEFSSASLNTNIWENMTGNGDAYGISGWGNNEAEYYQGNNSSVRDGKLVITAKKESVGGYSYTSSRLRTKGKVKATYGKIEARISLPAVKGLWPAFWMLPEKNYENQGWPHSGEIDIMEAKGRLTNQTSGALHYSNDNNQHAYEAGTNVFKLTDYTTIGEYHNYGIIWNEQGITWYCDDNQFMTVSSSTWHTDSYSTNDSSPFNQPFHILLNMAVGGNFDNGVMPPDSFTSAEMLIDYVRIYDWIS